MKNYFKSLLGMFSKKAKPGVKDIDATVNAGVVQEAEIVDVQSTPTIAPQEPIAPVVPTEAIPAALMERIQSLEENVTEQQRLRKEENAQREERRLQQEERKLQLKAEALKMKQEQLAAKQAQRDQEQARKAEQKAQQQTLQIRKKAVKVRALRIARITKASWKAEKSERRKQFWTTVGFQVARVFFSIWNFISFPFRKGRPKKIGKGLWITVKVLWAFPVAFWRWWCQSNNLRARVGMWVALVVTVWFIWHGVNQFQLRAEYPFTNDIVKEFPPAPKKSIIKSDSYPDPFEFFGHKRPAKKKAPQTRDSAYTTLFANAQEQHAKDEESLVMQASLDSPLSLGIRYLVILPLVWLLAILYWIISRNDETLKFFKERLESIKEARAQKKQGAITHGSGSKGRSVGGQPARVITAFTPVAVAAGGAVAVPVVEEKHGKFESLLLKALAAEEVIEYSIKFIDWLIKRKGKQS
ncbi:MAG: cell envelope integrity protein TolA [Patescibacteria group bacterium]|jgi:hypothetical protein